MSCLQIKIYSFGWDYNFACISLKKLFFFFQILETNNYYNNSLIQKFKKKPTTTQKHFSIQTAEKWNIPLWTYKYPTEANDSKEMARVHGYGWQKALLPA